jgi:hypothetical protein
VFEDDLEDIFRTYTPDGNPVTAALVDGGPAALAELHNFRENGCYADACHYCYRIRQEYRARYPDILTPDPVYGIF